MVDVHLDVAGRFHAQIHQAVLGPGFQHVTEERDRRGDLRRARAVEIELEPDLGLLRLALDASLPAFRLAAHAREPPCPAALVAIRTSAAAPCPARPSTRVKARRCGSAAWSPVAAYSMTLVRVTKSSAPNGDEKRAVPAVGSTWLGPAT